MEASVLTAGRISHKLMAELTGVEPVPADRQSAILPMDHGSGSLLRTRTTISALRGSVLPLDEKGIPKLSKNWLPGSDSNARTRIQSPGPASGRPGITFSVVSLSCTARTIRPTLRRCGQVACGPYAHDLLTRGDHRRAHNRAPMRAQFQNHRVQSFGCS